MKKKVHLLCHTQAVFGCDPLHQEPNHQVHTPYSCGYTEVVSIRGNGASLCRLRHMASSEFLLQQSPNKLPLLPEVFRSCGWWRIKQWITLFIIPYPWPSQRAGVASQLTRPQRCLWVWTMGKPVVWGLFCFHCEPNFQQFLCPGWLLLIYAGFKTTDWGSRVKASAVAY